MADDPSADDLLRRFLAGDPSAARNLEKMVGRIVRFEGYYIPAAERQDVVQEVLLHLWRAARSPDLTLRVGFAALVRTVSCRRCVDWMRRRRAAHELSEAIPDGRPGPESRALRDDRRRLAREVLLALGSPCRELVRMHAVEDRTYKEIATLTGRTEGALRTQMYECLKEARRLAVRATGGGKGGGGGTR